MIGALQCSMGLLLLLCHFPVVVFLTVATAIPLIPVKESCVDSYLDQTREPSRSPSINKWSTTRAYVQPLVSALTWTP